MDMKPAVRTAMTQELAALVQSLREYHLEHAMPSWNAFTVRNSMEARVEQLIGLLEFDVYCNARHSEMLNGNWVWWRCSLKRGHEGEHLP